MFTPFFSLTPLAAAVVLAAAAPVQAAAPSGETIIPIPLNPTIPAAQRVCTAKSATGVGTRALRAGAPEKPAATDYVLVDYIGYLAADGTVFDQGSAATFPLDGVIKGFAEGIQTIGRGGVGRICIPAALGYADKPTGPIPANSDLVFQVELVDFKTAAEVQAMQQQAEQAPPPPPQ
jgi:FKBP-type peptidyl-prolyl cis-trans isomerase FkpA